MKYQKYIGTLVELSGKLVAKVSEVLIEACRFKIPKYLNRNVKIKIPNQKLCPIDSDGGKRRKKLALQRVLFNTKMKTVLCPFLF